MRKSRLQNEFTAEAKDMADAMADEIKKLIQDVGVNVSDAYLRDSMALFEDDCAGAGGLQAPEPGKKQPATKKSRPSEPAAKEPTRQKNDKAVEPAPKEPAATKRNKAAEPAAKEPAAAKKGMTKEPGKAKDGEVPEPSTKDPTAEKKDGGAAPVAKEPAVKEPAAKKRTAREPGKAQEPRVKEQALKKDGKAVERRAKDPASARKSMATEPAARQSTRRRGYPGTTTEVKGEKTRETTLKHDAVATREEPGARLARELKEPVKERAAREPRIVDKVGAQREIQAADVPRVEKAEVRAAEESSRFCTYVEESLRLKSFIVAPSLKHMFVALDKYAQSLEELKATLGHDVGNVAKVKALRDHVKAELQRRGAGTGEFKSSDKIGGAKEMANVA